MYDVMRLRRPLSHSRQYNAQFSVKLWGQGSGSLGRLTRAAFVALNRVSGNEFSRTESTIESAECVKAFTPKIVYPYHYRGSKPEEFAEVLRNTPGVEVRIRKLEAEP
jgi:hypothetical protein